MYLWGWNTSTMGRICLEGSRHGLISLWYWLPSGVSHEHRTRSNPWPFLGMSPSLKNWIPISLFLPVSVSNLSFLSITLFFNLSDLHFVRMNLNCKAASLQRKYSLHVFIIISFKLTLLSVPSYVSLLYY